MERGVVEALGIEARTLCVDPMKMRQSDFLLLILFGIGLIGVFSPT
jgi:hypothetical protein